MAADIDTTADVDTSADSESTDNVATEMADSESQLAPEASSPAAASPGDVDRALEATLLRERVAALEAHIDDLEATLAAREATIEDQRDQLAALTATADETTGDESPSTVWRRLLRWLRTWG